MRVVVEGVDGTPLVCKEELRFRKDSQVVEAKSVITTHVKIEKHTGRFSWSFSFF